MRTTTAIAAFVVVGSVAAGAGAIGGQYQGSDTQFQLTAAALLAAGLTPANAYIGGGSGNAASAMTGALPPYLAINAPQQTGPMSRMLANEANVCAFNSGTSGSGDTSASGIVLGLDAVAIWSADSAGGAAACNGTADNIGYGLAYTGSSSTIFSGTGTQNWKWILALLYGGKDYSNPGALPDCGSAARQSLVGSWVNLFQSATAHGCGNTLSQCSTTPVNGGLWHAFRRDDASGTSDVFASILGLSPGTSASSVNGFGTSPYCNAMNWDTSAGNAVCRNGPNDQWTGPGGIVDPNSKCVIGGGCGAVGTGNHRRPPPGAWGDAPDSTQTTNLSDVLPTQFQDNDPIRQPCIGGTTNTHDRAGEEICNIDGKLGVVLPIPDTDWIRTQGSPPPVQYPTNNCNDWGFGNAPLVFTCPIRGSGTRHLGECPNGDALYADGCMVPIDSKLHTSQCVATKASIAPITQRTLFSPDGRIYNIHMRVYTTTEPIGYAQYTIPSIGITLDMVGGYSRIHQVETTYGRGPPDAQACQLVDMTDQIGCLVQADPCSIGYAGAGAQTFALRPNGVPSRAPGTPLAVDPLRVAQVAPSTATVQALGTSGEYQLARKLYLVSLPGFNNVAVTLGDPGANDELTLAQFEATPTNIDPILTTNGFFTLGAQSPGGLDTPFCEDFNEQTVCNPSPSSPSTLPANVSGCTSNPLGIPTQSATCGNGVREAYEECDNGLNNGTTGNNCSQTCRCVNDFNNITGACN